jgi:hypothetical protein
MRNFELTAELWQLIWGMVGVEFRKWLDLLRILLVEFCDWGFAGEELRDSRIYLLYPELGGKSQ